MSDELKAYAQSSAEWLRGMETHIAYGLKDWVVGRSILAASEIDKCLAEIESLRARLEKAEAERVHWQNEFRAVLLNPPALKDKS